MPEKYKDIPFYGRDVYIAAHKYVCAKPLVEIRKIINARLKEVPSEACIWYEMSILYDDPELKVSSLECFVKHTMEVLESNDFKRVKPETISVIFKAEALNITNEYDLVTALEKYLEANTKINLEHKDIKEAKRAIRFLVLTRKQIYQTPILTADEKAGILYCYEGNDDEVTMKKLELSMERLFRQRPGYPGLRRTPRKRVRFNR